VDFGVDMSERRLSYALAHGGNGVSAGVVHADRSPLIQRQNIPAVLDAMLNVRILWTYWPGEGTPPTEPDRVFLPAPRAEISDGGGATA
jgi:hypothetical protein